MSRSFRASITAAIDRRSLARRVQGAALACLCASVLGALSPGGAEAQRIQTIGRVIATSDVSGRFVHPVCDRDRTLEPANAAAFTFALHRDARAADRPLIVDMGGLLSPHGVARYAAAHRPRSLARLVRRLGYRALAFGLSDLAAPREPMLEVIRDLRARQIPVIASNLRCRAEAQEVCDALVDASDGPSLHVVNERLTAVLAVMRPDAGSLVAPDRARGLVFEDPKASIERFTRLARERGAEMVVAVMDAHVEDGPVSFASQLDPGARPDLLLVSGDDDILFARPTTVQPVLVGAPVDDAVEVLIRTSAEMRVEGYEMLAQPLGGRGVTAAEPVLDWIDEIGESYCEAWGRPLAGADLGEEPMTPRGMLELAAAVLRERTGADIAVLNRQILDSHWVPAHGGALTASDVYIALEYDEPLQVTEVDAAWVQRLARAADTHSALVTPGLTFAAGGGGVKVDGHAVETRARYRVATVRFLAAGGDAVLPELPRGSRWISADEMTLRTVVLEYLEEAREGDPRQALEDPAETLEWIFRADADLTFSGSRIDNPRRRCTDSTPADRCVDGLVVNDAGAAGVTYGTTQLNLSDALTFGVTLDLAANAQAPDWTWQNAGNVLYRTTWIETGDGGFVEAADQIRARSTLSWRGLRHGDADVFYLPDPTVDLFVESEFTQPDSRDFHWLLTRPTLGLRFPLLDKLQLQLSGGFEVQPLSDTAEVEPGIGGTLTLAPWDFLKLDQQFARLAFTFDYFVADLGDDNRGALRGQLDAAFDLFGPLALSVRVNLLMQHEEGQDVGFALSATAGVRLGYLGRATGP